MFDRVIVHASDLEASRRFYATLLGSAWGNFELAPVEAGPTRRLHIGFAATSRGEVDAFWRRGVEAGYESDGEPGTRPQYSTDYYGAFLLDPDGNSVEAVHHGSALVGDGIVDHLWIRVGDLAAAHGFWTRVAGLLGLRFTSELAERFHLAARGRSFALVSDGRARSEHVHLVFPLPAGVPGFTLLDPDGNTIEAVAGAGVGNATAAT
jgi:catechol 2,3-dioxygenase-like lactoylglutathione lyase family enzyme